MNYIESVQIDDFWGDKEVNIEFQENENFLIGVNGSGKTTIINLIAASLTPGFTTLDRIEFKKIKIILRNKYDKRKSPRIEIIKESVSSTPYQRILMRIVISSSEDPFEIYLDDLEEDRLYRHPNDEYRNRTWLMNDPKARRTLHYHLKKLFNISWLSIHRYRANQRRRDDISHESLVDQKISDFSTQLLLYLSQLKNLADDETDKFQKFIFLSLISVQKKEQLYQVLESVDPDKEKESLKEIYDLFNINEQEYKSKLSQFFKEFKKSFKKTKNISFEDAEYLLGTRRIHTVVEEWNNLVNMRKEIYKYRDTFIDVINSLLQKKKLIFNEKNELQVKTQSGKILDLKHLSSGEKQLVIIMGETLLQQSEPHIFIADEPELSLHIEWQEKLVDSLKSLNPNCQIIFATHSPDIVSHYSNSVIQIDNAISQ